jgi:hypothetical protein
MKIVKAFTQTFYYCTDPRGRDYGCGHYDNPDQIYGWLAVCLVHDDPKHYDKYPVGSSDERQDAISRVTDRLERWLKWKDSVTEE